MISDIVVDLQYGDCGKGKVTHHLCRTGEYTHVIRYNGGCNAGHTIFHKGKKFITHHIPAGVFFGIRSIIGPGCVVNVEQFFKEIEELKAGGIDTDGLVFIAKNAHIITQNHIEEEAKETKIGTTKRGNGPAYRDKFARTGVRAEDVPELRPYLMDLYEELHERCGNPIILFPIYYPLSNTLLKISRVSVQIQTLIFSSALEGFYRSCELHSIISCLTLAAFTRV